MILQELIALNEAATKVKLLVITPGYMGVAAIMPRIIDEFGMNVVGVSNKDTGDMVEGLLAVLAKDEKKVVDLINGGAFDGKYEKPRAKLAPAAYYDSVDLEQGLEDLLATEKHRKTQKKK
jgi:hypothetical protein